MSELQDIFVNINKGSNADSEIVCTLLQHLQGYHFAGSLDIPNDDQAVIYYSKKNCERCHDVLTVGKMDETQIKIHESSADADMKEKEELDAIASRGGLLKPSDLVYVTCAFAWSLYYETKKNQQALDFYCCRRILEVSLQTSSCIYSRKITV